MIKRLPYQVAFLSGQSNPNCWALSPIQARFMALLELPAGAAFPLNFPYWPTPVAYRPTSILRASINNSWMYLRSRTRSFRECYREGLITLLDRAEQTIFLAGSCGLELLANLQLEKSHMERIRVFAFGPVARSVPSCEVVLVQGRRDWLSRQFFPRADHLIECAHMDYLSAPEMLTLCKEFVAGDIVPRVECLATAP